MKLKPLAIGIVMVLCAGAGVFLLVRLHQGAAAPANNTENAPSVVSVQVGSLRRATLHHYVEGYGMIETAPATPSQPAAGAPLAPPTAGVVARVAVVEGQKVKKGEVLVELNAGALTVDFARQEAARQEELYKQHNASLKNLQAAQAQLAALQVVAPLSGTLTRLNARPGQAVDVNTVVAELADLNRLAVAANIPASEMKELRVGEELQVLIQPAVSTTVHFISPAVDTSNNTVSVLGLLPENSGLRPGQFVPLQVVTGVHTNCLAAPEKSVVTDIDGQSVLSLVTGNEATRMAVQTGFHENGWVEVSGPGLKAGDTVVTVGAYGLPDKTQISVVSSLPAETTPATTSPARTK